MLSYAAPKVIGMKRGKKIGERSVEELVGSDVEEFLNSDRYENFFIKSPHTLIFKTIFDYPWDVSVN